MHVRARRLVPAGLAGVAAALALSAGVLGYAGEVVETLQVTGPSGTAACGSQLAVHAVILNSASDPVTDHAVSWAIASGGMTGDEIVDPDTTSDAQGVATTSVHLACGGDSRTVVLTATADDIVGQVTVTVAESTTGLPRASTLAPDNGPSIPSVVLAAIAVIAGAALVLRRVATERG